MGSPVGLGKGVGPMTPILWPGRGEPAAFALCLSFFLVQIDLADLQTPTFLYSGLGVGRGTFLFGGL